MSNFLLKNARVYKDGHFIFSDVFVSHEGVLLTSAKAPLPPSFGDSKIFDLNNKAIIPGLVDVHVHLREPGFLYKETMATGTLAAARGGVTALCSMPNLVPVPDNDENLKVQEDAIKKDAKVRVFPFGAITKGEKGEKLADIEEIADRVIGFSDDGNGVADNSLMEEAMRKIQKTGKVLAAHCEDMEQRDGGYIFAGEYAKKHGHKGINSASEWMPIKRDIELVRKTGCKYHVCHISTKESVELIRQAKREGLNVTCETAPHYLLLDEGVLCEDARFKMNPPLRGREDREALLEGICDGTIDMIATDHAPHSADEKNKGLGDSMMGVVGIETSFALCYTYLVKAGIISFERLIELMCINPAKRFGIGLRENDLAIFDLEKKYVIDPKEFLSKGRSTPFEGWEVYGEHVMTFCNGERVL